MIGLAVLGVDGGAVEQNIAALDLGRGAIVGAFIVAIAFLAGYSAVKRSTLALSATAMAALAAALEFSWLGFFPSLPSEATVLFMGMFAAAGIFFVSSMIGAAKNSSMLGGVLFAGAITLSGLGLINFLDRIDVAAGVRWGAIGFGGFAVVLAAAQALRGDSGARLILPGIALALLAPIIGPLGYLEPGAMALASHALFTFGVLAISVVSIVDGSPSHMNVSLDAAPRAFEAARPEMPTTATSSYVSRRREREDLVIDSQLGHALDYSGIGVWDWSVDHVDQSAALPGLLGSDSDAPFTPDAFRQFVSKDDLKLLETEVLAGATGRFDVTLKLFDGRAVRMRGARAARGMRLERVVAFVEAGRRQNEQGAINSDQQSTAFDVDKIVAAFQPIVTLDSKNTVGYEALARNNGQEGDTLALIRAAARAGKSTALAKAMLAQATAFLVEERATNKSDAPDFIALNVSWSQIQDNAFIAAVEAAFKENQLPAGAIVLEITEGEAIGNVAIAAPIFKRLKAAGAALAFDDFGAGFSCLSNVRKYHFDYIKIDKSFADDLEAGGDGSKIVKSLADLGASLGLKVIIEGIESPAAAKAAKTLGCSYGQGYALGRPGVASNAKAGSNSAAVVAPTTNTASSLTAAKRTNDVLANDESDKKADEISEKGGWRPWRRPSRG